MNQIATSLSHLAIHNTFWKPLMGVMIMSMPYHHLRNPPRNLFVTKQHPSIEVKKVFDEELDHYTSDPPCNPQHILEATNGSGNNEEDPAPDGNKEDEVPEESDEAKLGM